MRDLAVEKLWGIGPASAKLLRDAGFETIGQVVSTEAERLVELLGKWGHRVWDFAHGRDDRTVEPPGVPKLISSETTYERDLSSWQEAWPTLEKFAEELESRLERWSLRARTVTLKVRFQDFTTITRSLTPGSELRGSGELLEVTEQLTRRAALEGRRIRLVGLGVSNLLETAGDSPFGAGQLAAGPEGDARGQMTLWEADKPF